MAVGPMEWDREPGSWSARAAVWKCDRCGVSMTTIEEKLCTNCRRDLRREASLRTSPRAEGRDAVAIAATIRTLEVPAAVPVDLSWKPGRRRFGR